MDVSVRSVALTVIALAAASLLASTLPGPGRRGTPGRLLLPYGQHQVADQAHRHARAEPAPLRLLAEDPDDLAVVSAALQDAVAKVGDIVFEPRARRLTIVFNRYRWEAGGQRVRSALQLGVHYF